VFFKNHSTLLLGTIFTGLTSVFSASEASQRNTRNEITNTDSAMPTKSAVNGGSGVKRSVRTITRPAPKKWSFNSFTEFAGPSAEFSLPIESYSPYADDFSPMQLFQSLNLAYAFNPNNKVGTEWSGIKPLQSDVIDKFGGTYSTQFVLFDPIVYYDFFNFIQNKTFWANGRFAVSLPLSDFSKKNQKITDLYLGYFLKLRLPNPKWYFGVNLEGWIFFWEKPVGFNVVNGSAGHNLGYKFSPAWSLDTGTVFDFSYISGPNSHNTFSEGAVDRMRFTLRYQPLIDTVQLGAFFQAPLYDRRPDRMALGMNLNLWF
jgi:hypothetical protein